MRGDCWLVQRKKVEKLILPFGMNIPLSHFHRRTLNLNQFDCVIGRSSNVLKIFAPNKEKKNNHHYFWSISRHHYSIWITFTWRHIPTHFGMGREFICIFFWFKPHFVRIPCTFAHTLTIKRNIFENMMKEYQYAASPTPIDSNARKHYNNLTKSIKHTWDWTIKEMNMECNEWNRVIATTWICASFCERPCWLLKNRVRVIVLLPFALWRSHALMILTGALRKREIALNLGPSEI